MSTVTTVTCDQCGADLTSHDTGYTLFRLHLASQEIRRSIPFSYADIIHRPAGGDFCDYRCLAAWLAAKGVT